MVSPVELRSFTFKSRRETGNRVPDAATASPHQAKLYKPIRPLPQCPNFVSCPDKSDIRLYDAIPQSEPHLFDNSDDFEHHISSNPNPHTRIVSICCRSSIDPLGITETAMQKLLDVYDIDDSFFDHVVSFGDKPRACDAGHGGMTVREGEDGSFDMQYRFTYPEVYRVRGSTKYTKRQISVFHRYSVSGTGSLWIFLNARPDAELQSRLEKILAASREDAAPDWFSLHLLVFATYLGNWRGSLQHLGETIEEAADIALTRDLSDLKTVSENQSLVRLLHPQYLGSTLKPLTSELETTLVTIRKLAMVNELFLWKNIATDMQHRKLANATAYYTSTLEGHLKSVDALGQRVQDFSSFLSTALTLSSQARMLQLADASVEDNANVFVVTIVSLFYLPASFVATFLGMNLFDFNGPDGGDFATAKKFWIFFAATVPLTCLTVGFWYILTRRRERARKQSKSAS
ncbi:hypothetical protein BDW74DRAFT_23535 [Aspergillus multicolor]|uniref:uncharacterized protein n=1 Tax=Aspergillus multicolor TaxID=41759 RepID=UPI003CCE0D61